MLRIEKDWQVKIIQLLSVVGIVIAYFLYLYHEGSLIGVCTPSSWDDCGQVSGPGAPYASVGPIPVALIGMIGYIAIFGLTWLRDWLPLLDEYVPELMLGMTGLAFLFSLWLTVLEIFVIHAVCRYCVISAIIVTVMFVLSISYLRSVNHSADA